MQFATQACAVMHISFWVTTLSTVYLSSWTEQYHYVSKPALPARGQDRTELVPQAVVGGPQRESVPEGGNRGVVAAPQVVQHPQRHLQVRVRRRRRRRPLQLPHLPGRDTPDV